MAHVVYYTRLSQQIELVEVEFPPDMDSVSISECTRLMHEGGDLLCHECGAEFSIVEEEEVEGKRLTMWDDADDDIQPVRLARSIIRNHGVTCEEFLRFVEEFDSSDRMQFILYLSNKGYPGRYEEMMRSYYWDIRGNIVDEKK